MPRIGVSSRQDERRRALPRSPDRKRHAHDRSARRGASAAVAVAARRRDGVRRRLRRTRHRRGPSSASIARPARRPTPTRRPPDPAPAPRRRRRPDRAADAEPALPTVVLRPGDQGEQVRELQHRLFQLAWLPEVTTGAYDATTKEAVQGFQVKRACRPPACSTAHLASAEGDDEDADARPLFNVLHPGPALLAAGDEGDEVRDLQARLKQIAWFFGDVTGDLRRRRPSRRCAASRTSAQIPVTGEVDQRTLDRLHAMTATPTPRGAASTSSPQPGALDPRCRTGRVLCVDKTSRTAALGDRRQGRRDAWTCASARVDDTPTREGAVPRLLQKRATTSRSSTTPSMPFAMFFSGGQAVHYSLGLRGRRLRRRLARLRERPRLRRRRVAVRPGAGRRQGRRLLVLTARTSAWCRASAYAARA